MRLGFCQRVLGSEETLTWMVCCLTQGVLNEVRPYNCDVLPDVLPCYFCGQFIWERSEASYLYIQVTRLYCPSEMLLAMLPRRPGVECAESATTT